jgi:GntR family transcriptional regulator / MocR family aminotransferase
VKRRTTAELALLGPAPRVLRQQWLYDELRAAIVDGRLARGAQLPATRDLARQCGVSRGTAVAVFEQLRSEGYLVGRIGAGTYVSATFPEELPPHSRGPAARADAAARPRVSRFASRLSPVQTRIADVPRPFLPEPAIEEFPITLWARMAGRCLRGATRSMLRNADPRGYRPLRQAIAEYVGASRGVACTAEQVLVVSGIQHGLDITTRVLLDSRHRVCVEDPCYPVVAAMFTAAGATVVPVGVDDEGLDIEQAKRWCARPSLIYVTPAHQFPLGSTLSLRRRIQLTSWAHATGAWIFEDDYDSEYRFSGPPIAALKATDPHDRVVFSGSFSKVLLPALRLGYLVVPRTLVEAFAAARQHIDGHPSVIDQAVMCEFLTQGHFGRHLRRMRELYATRLARLRDATDRLLRGAFTLSDIDAGLHVTAWLAPDLNAERLAQDALAHDVHAIPLSRFVLRRSRPQGLLLGFAAYDRAQIDHGVERLAIALERLARKTGAG